MNEMELDLKTWYVLHDGLPDTGAYRESNPLADVNEPYMVEQFHETISKGFADKDLGLYLVRLDNVKPEQLPSITDDLDNVVQSEFAGFQVTEILRHKTSLEDWSVESRENLDHLTEGLTPDPDGWYRM